MVKLEARIETNKERDREDLLARLEAKKDANQTKTDDYQERIDVNLTEMREEIKSGQAEMRSILDEWLMARKTAKHKFHTADCVW
jgi:hypothetical protein